MLDKKRVFFDNIKKNIKEVFFLCKYYFLNILKRNWLFFYFYLVTSVFSAFFFPIVYFKLKQYASYWVKVVDHKPSEDGTIDSLKKFEELSGGFDIFKHDYIICQKKKYQSESTEKTKKEREKKITNLEKEIEEKKKEIAFLKKNNKRGYDNQIKVAKVELADLLDKRRHLVTTVLRDSMEDTPFFCPFITSLTTGEVKISKPKKFLFWAIKSAFWHYSTGLVFLLTAWLIRELFHNFEKEGEDAMVILAFPGITRREMMLAKFLTLSGFLSLFSLVGFVYPVTVCWFLFGTVSTVSVLNLLMINLFMLFIAPVIFNLVVSFIIFFSAFTNQFFFLSGVFLVVFLPWIFFLFPINSTNTLIYNLLSFFIRFEVILFLITICPILLYLLKRKYDKANLR